MALSFLVFTRILPAQVAVLGGQIGAMSKQGLGSTFWFTVPLVAPPGSGPDSEGGGGSPCGLGRSASWPSQSGGCCSSAEGVSPLGPARPSPARTAAAAAGAHKAAEAGASGSQQARGIHVLSQSHPEFTPATSGA